VNVETLTEEDAFAICGILVATKRGIPADKWVDELVAAGDAASFEAMM
jgi:hypothetical protein